MQNPPQTAGGAREELRADVKQVSTTATNRLNQELDDRKGVAADQAKSLSGAIERTAGQLDDGSPAWLKSSLEQGAKHIQRFADSLDQKDAKEITNDVRDFARNSPGVFLAGCAAAGFAAARIFKAGGEQAANQPTQPGPVGEQQSAFDTTGAGSPFPTSRRGEFA
ncbi:MAG: hypothetical protein M3Q83_05790 [Pseudomonadota bacterium]|nr:hypothetical protein [Pseudomonadota bacterium]